MGCDDCCSELQNGQELIGRWEVVEVGYSPGSGYVTEKIEQSKFIEFGADHHFQSNYEGLDDIHYFRIVEDADNLVLELFPTKPEENNPDQLAYKYEMAFEEDLLKLMYAYCIEGCHIGIRKVE